MAKLFNRNYKTIRKSINNALNEELDNEVVVAKFANTLCKEARRLIRFSTVAKFATTANYDAK